MSVIEIGGVNPADTGLTPAAILSAFLACFGGPLGIVLEIAAALLTAFLAGLGSAFGIVREVAFTATLLLCHYNSPVSFNK